MLQTTLLLRTLAIFLASLLAVGLTSLLLSQPLLTVTNLVSVLSLTVLFMASSYWRSRRSQKA